MTVPYAPTMIVGQKGSATTVVTAEMTAPHVGSGTVPVYATPMLVALMEAAAVDCVEKHLAPGHASLGTHIEASHIAATPRGQRVSAMAELAAIESRKLTFHIEARDEVEVIGRATHTRVVVDVARFTAKLLQKTE